MPETDDPTVLKIILAETQKANNKLDKIEDAIARQDQMIIAHEASILHLNRLVWADAGALTTRVGQIEATSKALGEDVTKVHLRISGNETFKWSLMMASVVALLGVCGSLVVWGLEQKNTVQNIEQRQIQSVEKLDKAIENADNK